MKMIKTLVALLLAISFVFSLASLPAFAVIESDIIPVLPETTEWFNYEFNTADKTAVLNKFNYVNGRYNVTIRNSVQWSGETYSVIGIAANTFMNTDIQTVTIAEGVKTIGANAFADCDRLQSVSIASTVESIDSTAFNNTSWLANQPDGVVYAGRIAYKVKGTSPESVILNSDTVAIADGAFAGQTSLKKIFIPASTVIGEDAFADCTQVTFYCAEGSPAALYATANNISVVYIPSLALKSEPTKLEYYKDEALDLSGAELVYVSEAGETLVEVLPEMVSGYDATVLGSQTVTITYEGKTVKFQVNVVERPAYVIADFDGDGDVDLDDAIYLLYHVNFPNLYPVNQPIDYTGDAKEDLDDAIYLLYHVNFPNLYPLQ